MSRRTVVLLSRNGGPPRRRTIDPLFQFGHAEIQRGNSLLLSLLGLCEFCLLVDCRHLLFRHAKPRSQAFRSPAEGDASYQQRADHQDGGPAPRPGDSPPTLSAFRMLLSIGRIGLHAIKDCLPCRGRQARRGRGRQSPPDTNQIQQNARHSGQSCR